MAIPLLVYSDGPRQPTGLARITRDLVSRLWAERETLGIDLLQLGYDPLPGPAVDWPLWTLATMDMSNEGDWGASQVDRTWWNYFGEGRQGVLLSIWDPGRAFALLKTKLPSARWGYFPIDATNVRGSLSGTAAETVRRYDRVLAYGAWGASVLKGLRSDPVPYLPHGLDLDTWTYELSPDLADRAEAILQRRSGEWVLGCVATNQPRKDLALYFGTLAELRRRGEKVRGWLHTDAMSRYWNVLSLVEDFGLAKKVTVTLTLEDWELAGCYACCGVTLAPGLGEGFGYPIVESLACGTPCVHGDYAGGAELLPLNAWRVPVRAERVEGFYSQRRPVFSPVDMANAVQRALDWKRQDERVVQAYCRMSVEHLGWTHLWPRWRSWFKQGLEEV